MIVISIVVLIGVKVTLLSVGVDIYVGMPFNIRVWCYLQFSIVSQFVSVVVCVRM